MQTPKARISTSEVPQKVSPRATSVELPPKASPQTVSSKGPQKVSPRIVQRLKTAAVDSDLASSPNKPCRTPRGNSFKAVERKAPRSLANEKKHPSRVVELESQVSQLERELEKVKDQLNSSEAWRKQAEAKGSPEQHLVDSATLADAINEIKELKFHLEAVVKVEASQNKQAKLAQNGLKSLEEKLIETLALMGDVRDKLTDCGEVKPHARALVTETLTRLETAKSEVEILRSDGGKSMEACEAIALELERSSRHVSLLEELVHKLEASQGHAVSYDSHASMNIADGDVHSFKSEVERLRSALEAADARHNEEQTQSAVEIRTAHELAEQIRSTLSQRQTELETELKKSQYEIEELKADLMDKETELQGICEENEFLDKRLKSVLSVQKADTEYSKANSTEKESEAQSHVEENSAKTSEEFFNGSQETRTSEHVPLVGYMPEAGNKNGRRATRVLDQLMAAQAANSELEAELRRLKIQADQWRKAAEAAAAMLSSESNGNYIERTATMENNHCSPMSGKIDVPFSKAMDEDFLKRKNLNMLQKFGVLRKRAQK